MPPDAVSGVVPERVDPVVARTPARQPKQEYDGELFLHLLVTQLRNQDPSAAMDTSELVAQTTSLAMMEALNTVADTTQEAFGLQMRDAAAALIGRQVSWTDADGGERSGLATAVSFHDATPVVLVDGMPVRLDAVLAVTDAAEHPPHPSPAD